MSSQKFAGKVAIVTGSSSGIGQGVALLLAEQGANVTIHGRSSRGLKETEDLLRSSGITADRMHVLQGDIADPETVQKLVNESVERFGKIDIVVNNAAVISKPLTEVDSEENYDFTMDINLKSIFRLNKLAVPHLAKTKGNIVNISSFIALRVFNNQTIYGMSKAALDYYMRSESVHLAQKGIRMNNINPGLIVTNIVTREGTGWGVNSIEEFEKILNENFVGKIPMNRAGLPKDIANAISYIVSDEASYVCGTSLVVDGGLVNNM